MSYFIINLNRIHDNKIFDRLEKIL